MLPSLFAIATKAQAPPSGESSHKAQLWRRQWAAGWNGQNLFFCCWDITGLLRAWLGFPPPDYCPREARSPLPDRGACRGGLSGQASL